MIARIRKGNDFKHVWSISWNGLPEDFSDATDITLTATVYGKVKTLTEGVDYHIDGSTVVVDFTPAICDITGTYNLELNYVKPNNTFIDGDKRSAVDINAFQIVASSDDADTTGDTSSTSDAAIGLQGKSAYQLWLDDGNVGTEDDYFAYLRQPATDAAEAANTAAGLANNAATTANTAAGLADDARLAIQDDLASKADQTELDQLAGDVSAAFSENIASTLLDAEIIPNKSNALFHLDGTITQIGLDYYFADKTGNNRSFLITSYDFPVGWVKGFPYKSAATISAPVDDATLISADINNFLYDSDGTPNQISVVSLFSDVDYEHKLFCRHINRVVDEDGAEISESKVVDIVLYNSPKTGISLDIANIYFSIQDAEQLSYWVSASGSDEAGDGTKINPWKTVDKATDTVNDGRTVYVKSLSETGDATLGYIYNTKNNYIKAIGRVVLNPTSSSYGVRLRYDFPLGIEGIDLNSSVITTGWSVSIPSGGGISRSYAKFTDGAALITVGGDVVNCIFSGKTNANGFGILSQSPTKEVSIEYNLLLLTNGLFAIKNDVTSASNKIANNRIKTSSLIVVEHVSTAGGVELIGNEIIPEFFVNIFKAVGDLGKSIIKKNKITLIKDELAERALYIESAITNAAEIIGNKINNDDGFANFVIYLKNSQGVIKDNIISGNTEIISGGDIYCLPTDSTEKQAVIISGNKIISPRKSSYHIGVGTEVTTAGDNSIASIEISKNYVRGIDTISFTAGSACHGIFASFQKNANIRYNYVDGAAYGVIAKGSTLSTYTGGGISYNIVRNCKYGIYSKGVSGVMINNNTIVSSFAVGYGIYLAGNVGGDEADNCVVKNNIIICLGAGTIYMVQIAKAISGNVIDNNIYYCPNGTMRFSVGGVIKTFAEWQALGYDTNSVVLTTEQFNALFNDSVNGEYSLKDGSIAIGAGATLDPAYDHGLSATTNWGEETVVPSVVTKQQGANWDIGAYLS